MNTIWTFLVVISIVLLCFKNPGGFIPLLTESSTKAVTFAISLCSIYAIWMGLLNILKDSGLVNKLNKPFSKVIKFVFGDVSHTASSELVNNLTSNMLGIGSVGTISGIRATEALNNSKTISFASAMLVILNASSLQIFPTTLISLRASFNSLSPTDIFLPSLIVSTVTTIIAIFITKLMWKAFPPKNK